MWYNEGAALGYHVSAFQAFQRDTRPTDQGDEP
jgi:hypothetical protein